MKRLTRGAVALCEGAAALVIAGLVVFGVTMVVVLLYAAISPPPASARVAPAAHATGAVAPGGTGVPASADVSAVWIAKT